MMGLRILIFAAAIALAVSREKFDEQSYLYNPLSPHELPHGLQQERTCTTIGLGLEVLERICLQVASQYVAKFNEHQYKNIQDYEVHPLIGNYTVRLHPEKHELLTKVGDDGEISVQVELPVAISGEHRAEKWSHTFQGKSKVQFEIRALRANNTWQLYAHTDKTYTRVYQEGQVCQKMPEDECTRIFERLDWDLHRLTFPYGFGKPEPNFFYNQPTAIRTLLGMLAQLNHHLNASETHHAWIDDKVLGFNLGCTKEEVQQVLDGEMKAQMQRSELYLSSQGNTFGSFLSTFLASELAVGLNITDKDFEVQPFLLQTLERQETLKIFSIPANASTSFIRVEKDKHPEKHDQLVLFESNPSQLWDVNVNILQQFFKLNFSSSVVQQDKYFNKYSPYKSTVIDDDTVVRLFGQHKSSWLDEVTIKGVIWFQVDDDVDQPAWIRRRAREVFVEKQKDDDEEEEEGPPEDIGEEVAWKPNYDYIDLTTELHPSHLKNKSLLNVTRDWDDEEEDDYEEGEMPEIDDYLIILPVEFELRFLHQQRRGMSTIFGFTQEIKTKMIEGDDFFNITVKDCFLTPNPKYNGTLGEVPQYIDSEVCNKTEAINVKHLKAELKPAIEKAFKLRESMAARNDYFPLPAIDYSFQLLCSGLEMKQPQFGFEQIQPGKSDSRVVLRIPFKPKAMDISAFCDTYEPHMAQVDPRQVRQNRTKYLQIEQYMKKVQDNLTVTESLENLKQKFLEGFEGYWPKEHRDIKVVSPVVHLLSSFFPLRDWCQANHKTWNSDRCAIFYSFLHDHVAFDDYGESRNGSQADCKVQVYYNFHQQYTWLSGLIECCLWGAGYGILALGVGVSTASKKAFTCNQMVAIVFVGNVLLHLPGLLKVNYRQGIDYSAYIAQAGCVIAGETRYNRISSLQGPCFYPAGHLWFFAPAYLLHVSTESAEYIVKFVFFLLHSANLALVIKIAYAYFQHNQVRAQLVAFILLANTMDRDFVQMQFNDNLLALCLTAMIYCIVVGRPLLASAMFSLGLSVKAGALLVVPALMGVLQYRFGLLALIQGFLVAFAVQYVLGFLFLMRDADSYILDSRLFGHGPGKQDLVGAKYENSIYWTFVSRELYYSQAFNNQLKLGMLAMNAVYFFMRQNCFLQCVLNVFAPFVGGSQALPNETAVQTVPRMVVDGFISSQSKFYRSCESWARSRPWSGVQSDPVVAMQKSVEILVFGFLVGASMMPGGHRQFMLWYINLIPLAIEMLGLPWWLTAWWYQLVWPVDICSFDDRWIHQFLTFFIVGWLLTFGARRKQEGKSAERKKAPSKKVKVQ